MNIRNKINWLGILLSLLIQSGCNDSSPYMASGWDLDSRSQYFSVDRNSVSAETIPAVGGSHELQFSISDNWHASSSSSWIRLSTASGGAGQIALTLSADDNPSTEERCDTTLIIPDNEKFRPFQVITKQNGHYLQVETKELTFESSSYETPIVIDTDEDWTISTPNSWITFSETSGKGSQTVTATISAFPDSTIRQGMIVVRGSASGAKQFAVTQTCDNYQPWLSFTSDGPQTLQFTYEVPTLEYSVNGSEWMELGTKEVSFGGNNGELRLRGMSSFGTIERDYFYESKLDSIKFSTGNKVECRGDIRTLVDYQNYQSINGRNVRFTGLFRGCHQLISAPELPATTLASYCYDNMFRGCTSLTEAPKLPAITLSSICYYEMFRGCTSLTAAPELPATNLASYCYYAMFRGCTSLTVAPELPATTLAEGCYSSMSYGCTSLTSAPELPATTLTSYCYSSMFYGCNKLKKIKMMATNIIATDCLRSWTYGVSSSGTFIKNAAATWDEAGVVPAGWTVITE